VEDLSGLGDGEGFWAWNYTNTAPWYDTHDEIPVGCVTNIFNGLLSWWGGEWHRIDHCTVLMQATWRKEDGESTWHKGFWSRLLSSGVEAPAVDFPGGAWPALSQGLYAYVDTSGKAADDTNVVSSTLVVAQEVGSTMGEWELYPTVGSLAGWVSDSGDMDIETTSGIHTHPYLSSEWSNPTLVSFDSITGYSGSVICIIRWAWSTD
jgi:hypothetical protein